MSEVRELLARAAFGESVESAVILAVQPDEWEDSEEWSHRTFVLKLKENEGTLIEILPDPIDEVWRSDNGTAYCPTSHGQLMVNRNGIWSNEIICNRGVEFGPIFGFSGILDRDDILFTCDATNLFIRQKEAWKEVGFPDEVEEIYKFHGLSPTELYFCADAGLYEWNGKDFTSLEGPDDELLGVLVLSNTEMIAVGDYIHHWSDDKGWQILESPVDNHAGGVVAWENSVLIPTLEGVLRLHSNQLEFVSDFSTNGLVNVGNGVIAFGADEGLSLFDGVSWRQITLPSVRPGEVPNG